MSKKGEKLTGSPNTLLNYFGRSPASSKNSPKPSTPTSALARQVSQRAGTDSGDSTPKSKFAFRKEQTSVGKESIAKPAQTANAANDDEDEIVVHKKRRRVINFDDSEDSGDGEDRVKAPAKNGSVKGVNNNNETENDHQKASEKKSFDLSSFERTDEDDDSEGTKKSVKEDDDSSGGPAQKKIKLEEKFNLGQDDQELTSALEERTWSHQKLDFLKPNKIKDIQGNRPDSEKYDGRTLFVPEPFLGSLTPAMRQWWEVKSKHFDCVLFFKVGKFYELYHMDAEVGVTELGFSFMKGEFAHSGFPEQAYDRMSSTLVEKGYKVARVEQTETPEMMQDRCKAQRTNSKYDKVVRREVCQITVKGTEVYGQQVRITTNHQPRYMMAIVEAVRPGAGSRYGVCFIDTSIGLFHLGDFDDDNQQSRLLTLLSHYPPVLLLHERSATGFSEGTQRIFKTLLANVPREALTSNSQMWSGEKTLKYLAEKFYGGTSGEASQWPSVLRSLVDESDSLGLTPKQSSLLAMKALGGCVWYLQRCLLDQQVMPLATYEQYIPLDAQPDREAPAKDRVRAANANRFMVLDSITLKNLKIVGDENSLVQKMDHCCTKFGKRLFHHWVCAPSCEREVIVERQQAVGELIEDNALLQDVRQLLGQLPDLERLVVQIHGFGNARCSRNHPAGRAILYEEHTYGKKKIGDFVATLSGFRSLLALPTLFSGAGSVLLKRLTQPKSRNGAFPLDTMQKQVTFFESAFDHEHALKSGVIAPEKGVDTEYDTVERDIEDLKRELEEYRAEQSKYFGCTVEYHGNDKKRFQLEVPEARAKKARSEYSLEGTRGGKNAVKRFHTDETRQFLKQMIQYEDKRKAVLKDLSRRIFEKFSLEYGTWKSCVELVATLDVLTSLAEYARSEGVTCVPELLEKASPNGKPLIEIEEGIHPCVGSDVAERYIPNGIEVGDEGRATLVLLTGPNMGGKSTLMRQVGLLAVMAQMGSRIPAQSCRMTIIDRIFTRLGASDDIMAGHSTFLVELNETCAILRHATADSLVLLDELGRGTATYDGTAVAASVVHFLADLQCRTIFSTHYHNLVDSFQDDPRITLGHMACMVENEDGDDPTQETVTFLYRYSAGACPKSYGFNAAKLAGMPAAIIKRAYELSKTVEADALKRKIMMKLVKNAPQQEIRDLVVKLKSCQF
ncbi:probable DNA mismatch repair protein Msh6 [Anopheles cruzii]|uniref:probable DNA mismatch repair protein Msh6 n=1 Tax=Anopheles cruzii TaxID=68878 RepID=UPI0022EC710F|nr:probable DNA mismatch repair protein Msh6 [Anopheles cruzii]